MKKVLSFIAAVALIATCMLSTAFAAGTTITAASKDNVAVGETVSVDFKIAGNPGFKGYTIQVNTPEGLKLTAITAGEVSTTGLFSAGLEKARVALATSNAIADDGVLFTAEFEVLAEGSYTVDCTIIKFVGAENQNITVSAVAGTVATKVTTEAPTTEAPTTEAPTTEAPTTEAPTTEAPTTEAPTTEAPTTEAPKPEDVPTTGDNTVVMTYAVVMLAALAGAATVIRRKRA